MMPVIDVTPGRRIDISAIPALIDAATLHCGPLPQGGQRSDAAVMARHVERRRDALVNFRRDTISDWLRANAPKLRNDALSGEAGGLPRDFEFIFARELEERRRPLNYQRAFPIDRSIPVGAEYHTVRRRTGAGIAAISRGGTEDVPMVSTGRVEERFNTAYIVCGVETNFFRLARQEFAAINDLQADMRLAERVIEESINHAAFHGREDAGLYGFLNYPHISARVASVAFDGTADPVDVVAALNQHVNYAWKASGGTFKPNRLGVSLAVHAYLHQTKMSNTGLDTTIAEFFLRNQGDATGIRSIEAFQELGSPAAAPSGKDAVIAYDDSIDSTAFAVLQPPTLLPAYQASAFTTQMVMVAQIGGMRMPDVGNNSTLFVTPPAL